MNRARILLRIQPSLKRAKPSKGGDAKLKGLFRKRWLPAALSDENRPAFAGRFCVFGGSENGLYACLGSLKKMGHHAAAHTNTS